MKNVNNFRAYLRNRSSTSKKVIVLLVIMIAPIMSFGQSFFDKYESMKGVTSGVIGQKMFKMIGFITINWLKLYKFHYLQLFQGLVVFVRFYK